MARRSYTRGSRRTGSTRRGFSRTSKPRKSYRSRSTSRGARGGRGRAQTIRIVLQTVPGVGATQDSAVKPRLAMF